MSERAGGSVFSDRSLQVLIAGTRLARAMALAQLDAGTRRWGLRVRVALDDVGYPGRQSGLEIQS